MRTGKKDFITKSVNALEQIYDMIEKLPSISLSDLNPEETAFVIIDMINGFVREGALQSPRAEALIPEIEADSSFDDQRLRSP